MAPSLPIAAKRMVLAGLSAGINEVCFYHVLLQNRRRMFIYLAQAAAGRTSFADWHLYMAVESFEGFYSGLQWTSFVQR